jgi:hypothetical protein
MQLEYDKLSEITPTGISIVVGLLVESNLESNIQAGK